MTEAIRVLIADDHAIVRDGIQSLLKTEPQIQVVGEAKTGQEAVLETEKLEPDVVIMDLVMPEMDGVEATRRILAKQPQVRILVLTSFGAEDKLLPAIKAGALGYLLKDSGAEELVGAIRQVHGGASSLHPVVARKLIQELARADERAEIQESLTDREQQVLKLLARGMSNQQISQELVISEATVRNHVSNILSKLELESRTQAALYALREGLVSLDGTG
jgi:NarL family two-component system response regulator LiaR